jgi:hypothetical protein
VGWCGGDSRATGEIWDVDAAQRHDTPGTGMFAPEVLGPTVDRLAELAADGPALEFAIGPVEWPFPWPNGEYGSAVSSSPVR